MLNKDSSLTTPAMEDTQEERQIINTNFPQNTPLDAQQKQIRLLLEQKSYLEQVLAQKETTLQHESTLRRVAENQVDKLRMDLYKLQREMELERTQTHAIIQELRKQLGSKLNPRKILTSVQATNVHVQSNKLASFNHEGDDV